MKKCGGETGVRRLEKLEKVEKVEKVQSFQKRVNKKRQKGREGREGGGSREFHVGSWACNRKACTPDTE